MNIKLIASDLDDTLLDDSKVISKLNKEAIWRAKEKGIMMTLATGRMFRSATIFGDELGIDVPLITYQGALIKTAQSNQVIWSKTIELPIAREIISFGRKHGFILQIYVDDMLHVDYINTYVANYASFCMVPALAVRDLFTYIQAPPHKILMVGEPAELYAAWEEAQQIFDDSVYITKSKPYFLEFTNSEANKGKALSFLAESFGIKKEEIMVIGDNYNDMELFKAAGLKIAMGNAVDALKEQADFITANSSENGVAVAIEKFVI